MSQSHTAAANPANGLPLGQDHEIITPPNPLAKRAGSFRAANIDHDRVEQSIARVIRNYPEAVAPQVAEFQQLWGKIRLGISSEYDRKDFIRIAHDFKGQASSFGYPLVSRIAETLTLLGKYDLLAEDKAKPVVEAHVEAIRRILGDRIEGDGGPLGSAIIEGLQAATRRLAGR